MQNLTFLNNINSFSLRNEKEIARKIRQKEKEKNSNSISISKAANYFFNFSSSSTLPSSLPLTTTDYESSDVLLHATIEKERKKEEKSREKIRKKSASTNILDDADENENDDVSVIMISIKLNNN